MSNIKERSNDKLLSAMKYDEGHITKRNDNIFIRFEKFCESLVRYVDDRRIISPLDVNNFSVLTTHILRRNIVQKCEAFDELYSALSDYANNEYDSEDNCRRGRSYIQIHQLMTMVKNNWNDLESKKRAHIAAKSNRVNAEVIRAVHNNSGCTFAELRTTLSVSGETLTGILTSLNKQRILISRREGEGQFYLITHLGNTVYEELFSDTYNVWLDRWDRDRITLLCYLLSKYSKYESDFLVCDIVDIISSMSKSQVSKYAAQTSKLMDMQKQQKLIKVPEIKSPQESRQSLLKEIIYDSDPHNG